MQIDGAIIGGRGLNGTPGRAVAKSTCKTGDDTERTLMFSGLQITGKSIQFTIAIREDTDRR